MQEALKEIKYGPSETGVAEIILERWSPRAFSDQEVSKDDLIKIFIASSWAASSYNEQPWRFLVGRKGTETYGNIFSCLNEHNQTWAKRAPVLFLSVARANFTLNDQPNAFALHDAGAASATLALQAAVLDLCVHGMAGFDQEKARNLFQIPPNFLMGAVWALGYLGDPGLLPATLQAEERGGRKRKSLREFVFAAWDQPADL